MTANPCPWCPFDATHPCGTCLPRLAYEATLLPDEPPPCTTCIDAEWLLLGGEAWEQVAARLHVRPGSLATHCRRHGRDDLIPKAVAR